MPGHVNSLSSVTLLVLLAGRIAGEESVREGRSQDSEPEGGPFIQFQGMSVVNTYGNNNYKAGVYYPLSALNEQLRAQGRRAESVIDFRSEALTLPTSITNRIQSTNQNEAPRVSAYRKPLPKPTNRNAARRRLTNEVAGLRDVAEELTNEIAELPFAQKLPIDYHPEERLSMELIEKMKASRPSPSSISSPAFYKKLRELSVKKSAKFPASIEEPFVRVDFGSGRFQYSYSG